MGVLGLWSLLDPAGKPIPVESLENQVLAVDISIWLNQAVRGMRDKSGHAVPHAHLVGLYHRVCKLLFYKIKPVFVFDGKPPQLKRDTLNRRRLVRNQQGKKAAQASQAILQNYVKRTAVAQQLRRQTHQVEKVVAGGTEALASLLSKRVGGAEKEKDLFELPALPKKEEDWSSDSDEGAREDALDAAGLGDVRDVYQVDVTSSSFTSLSKELQYEVLNELKGKRKQNSWAVMHQMPKKAEDFSGFQFQRLMRRKQIQRKLETVSQEISEDAAASIDQSLFVGDRAGLKKQRREKREVMRMASRPDSHILLITKQRQERRGDQPSSSSTQVASSVVDHGEGGELLGSEDEDDPEVKEAIARSLGDSGELTQEEILRVIKKEAKSKGVKQEMKSEHVEGDDISLEDDGSDDDVEILLPDATVLLSSRLGGRPASPTDVKQEIVVKEEPAEVEDIDDPSVMESSFKEIENDDAESVGLMSDSDTDSDLVSVKSGEINSNSDSEHDSEKGEDDDLFADVFEGKESLDKLTSIVEKARVSVGNESSTAALVLNTVSNGSNPQSDAHNQHRERQSHENTLSHTKAQPNRVDVLKRVEKEKTANENPLVEGILESVTRLGKTRDIFAGIAATAKRLNKPQSQGEEEVEKETEKVLDQVEDTDKGELMQDDTEFRRQVTESLKSSSSLTMKILSRGAEQELSKAASSQVEEKQAEKVKEGVGGLLVDEQERLVREMQEVEERKRAVSREERLLKFTAHKKKVDPVVGKPVNSKQKDSSCGSPEEKRMLGELGVASEDSSEIQKRLAGEENENDGPPRVFASSAPGFVHVEKDGIRVEVMDEGGLDEEDQMLLDLSEEGGADGLLSEDELVALQRRLAEEQSNLVAERGKAERVAASLTDQMYAECQELLQLFGLPWLVAPTEAEAQCAFLDSEGLTQGTITDDSDIWLFGGKKVFRNFFNQEKMVTAYTAAELVAHFGLNRERLVLLAMLTGSDYTMGIQDVGPVTALEVLAEFPGENLAPLNDFKAWWSRVKGEGLPVAVGNKTREKLKRLQLPPSFPSEAVAEAYLKPTVDECREKFSWAVPNLVAARDFARERLGFDSKQVDQLLTPVVRSLAQKKSSQARIDSYFASWRTALPEGGRLGGSKRVEQALKKVRGEEIDQEGLLPTKQVEKKVTKKPSTSSSSKIAKKVKRPIEIEDDPRKKVCPEKEKARDKNETSLVAKSCGFVISASSQDVILQRQERERQAKEAKEKAIAVFKKSQEAKQHKLKKKFKRPTRVVKPDHGLSESDSD